MAENLKQIIEFQAKGIQKLKGQYKDLERRTKGLEGTTNKASGAMGGMIAKLGLTTVAMFGTMRAISGVVRVGKEFTKNMSNVAAISGAVGLELRQLELNAKQLGSTTVFTASQVAQLQVEFAKLGFSSQEIRGVTKDTLALASATGADLSTSAAVAGQTLRAFGLDVSETSRVTDTMAKSFSSSALDMDKFSNSMQYVAPIAKQVGFTIEGTTAMLGTLANAGISGSMAGTSLRKILLELGNENSKLTKKIGFSVKSSEDLEKALSKLSAEGIGTAEMKELVGQRAISAFNILMEGTKTTDELAKALNRSGGAAQAMADVQLDNLDGKLTLLNSALEGLGISIFDHFDEPLQNATMALTSLVSSVSDFLEVPMSEKLKQDSIETANLFNIASDLNATLDTRKNAIEKINIKYADYLPNLLDEESSLKDIRKAQDAVIAAELSRIALAINEEKIQELMSEKLKLQREEGALINNLQEKQNAYTFEIEQQALATEALTKKIKDQQTGVSGVTSALMDGTETAFLYQDTQKAGGVSVARASREFANATEALDRNRESSKRVTDEAIKLKKEAADLGKEFSSLASTVDNATDSAGGVDGSDGDPVSDITKGQLAFLQQFLQERQVLLQGDTFAQMEALTEQTNQLMDIYEKQGKSTTDILEFYDLKRAQIQQTERARTMSHYSQMASNFASFVGGFAGGQKAAARLQQVAAVVDALSAANQLYADPKLVAMYPANIVAGTAALASGMANAHAISKSIGEFKNAETGYSGVVDRPTMFMTGENNKAEQVNITPLESPNIAGGGAGGGITINVSAPLVSEDVIDTILPAIARAQQMELA